MRHWLSRFDMPEAEEMLKQALNVAVMLAVWGAFMGAVQWTVLRRRLVRAGWWAPATASGWGLAGVAAGIPGPSNFTPNGGVGITAARIAVGFIPFFLLTGLLQWLWLRQRVIRSTS